MAREEYLKNSKIGVIFQKKKSMAKLLGIL